jgi:hypothetical protein
MSEEVEETMKVKPWTVEEEKQLREMVEVGCSLREISSD